METPGMAGAAALACLTGIGRLRAMSGAKPRARSRARKRRLLRAFALGIALILLLSVAATVIPILLLASIAPPTTAFMFASRFSDPATGQPCDTVDYEWLDFELIAQDLGLAVIVAEDQRFFEHATKTIAMAARNEKRINICFPTTRESRGYCSVEKPRSRVAAPRGSTIGFLSAIHSP
jgi:hypothetical protein